MESIIIQFLPDIGLDSPVNQFLRIIFVEKYFKKINFLHSLRSFRGENLFLTIFTSNFTFSSKEPGSILLFI